MSQTNSSLVLSHSSSKKVKSIHKKVKSLHWMNLGYATSPLWESWFPKISPVLLSPTFPTWWGFKISQMQAVLLCSPHIQVMLLVKFFCGFRMLAIFHISCNNFIDVGRFGMHTPYSRSRWSFRTTVVWGQKFGVKALRGHSCVCSLNWALTWSRRLDPITQVTIFMSVGLILLKFHFKWSPKRICHLSEEKCYLCWIWQTRCKKLAQTACLESPWSIAILLGELKTEMKSCKIWKDTTTSRSQFRKSFLKEPTW